jgi:peptidyl-prolyl cis-trans isomerase A (cyclophilin A)
MPSLVRTFVLIVFTSLFCAAQSASTPQSSAAAPDHKTAPAVNADPIAIIHTTVGLAGGTKDWSNSVTRAKKHGVPLYDGTIFHRVIPEFMIQGGDPAGDGTGDPGYKFKNETSPDVTFDRPGRLAYANAGPDTNGSQFFITEVPYPSLNGGYTIFGQCDDDAVELIKKIARMPTNGETPVHPVKIIHIEIHRAGTAARPAASPGKPM